MNNFCMQKYIEKEIAVGKEKHTVRFYSIPHGTILKVKTAAKPLAKLISTLMTDTSKDCATDHTTVPSEQKDANGENLNTVNFVTSEISPSLASLRHKHMSEAIGEMLETLLDADTQSLLSEIIVRSAKDMFQPEDAATLADNMDTGTMFQFLSGAFEASASGISGLGKFLSPQTLMKAKETLAAVKGNVESL